MGGEKVFQTFAPSSSACFVNSGQGSPSLKISINTTTPLKGTASDTEDGFPFNLTIIHQRSAEGRKEVTKDALSGDFFRSFLCFLSPEIFNIHTKTLQASSTPHKALQHPTRVACRMERRGNHFSPLSSYLESHHSKMSVIQGAPIWVQKTVTLAAAPRGCHLVTSDLVGPVREALANIKVGLANFHIQHTSAGLTLNENADPDVRVDFSMFLDSAVPQTLPFLHKDEGDDDMPAHVKSTLFGASLNIPITNGKLALGQWQGIWLGEFRPGSGPRKVVITLTGVAASK